MGLEDLRKLRAEAEGVPYMTQEQQALLEASEEAEYQMKANEQQVQQYQRQQGQGIFSSTPHGVDVYFLNRMLEIRLPDKKDQTGLWLARTQMLEQFALTNMDKETFSYIQREYTELEDINAGEGNEELLQSKINELNIALQCLKSRGDLPSRGGREREQWNRSQISQETTMKMPEQDTKKKGFLSIFSGSG